MSQGKTEPRPSGAIDGLNFADPGVQLLATAVARAARETNPPGRVFAVHCGPLPGLRAPHLVLDVRQQMAAPEQAFADGLALRFRDLPRVDHAAVWPRAHLGKDFTFRSLAIGASLLDEGGQLWCAVRKAKGSDSIEAFMEALLGEAVTVSKSGGYRLLRSMRRTFFDEALAQRQLELSYTISDPRLGDLGLRSAPGVFSRRELDAGTALLIDHASALALEPKTVLDLGAGIGPLTLWAAMRWPPARLFAIESNFIALDLLRENARAAGVEDRVQIIAADGWTQPNAEAVVLPAEIELALVNPPTHADPETLKALLGGICDRLAPSGRVLAVASRAGRTAHSFEAAGMQTAVHDYQNYSVIEAYRPPREQ